MAHKFIVDRIEGEFAVCEDENGEMHDIALYLLPKECIEGSYISMKNDVYKIEKTDADRERENRIKGLMDELFD